MLSRAGYSVFEPVSPAGDADLLESDGLRQGEKLDLQHQVPCQEKHDSTDDVSLRLRQALPSL